MKDITNDLEIFNVGGALSNRGRMRMEQRFCKIIQNYFDVKQLRHTNFHFDLNFFT